MKKLLLIGIATTCITINAQAMELTPYVSAKLKYTNIDTKLKEPGFSMSMNDNVKGGSFAVGISQKTEAGDFRAELEYTLNENAKDDLLGVLKAEFKTQAVMLNTYYDIKTQTKLRPYIGYGIGFSRVKGTLSVDGFSASAQKNNLAWQMGGGFGYNITDHTTLDTGYRYMNYGSFSQEGTRIESAAHEVYIGLRYTF